VSVTRWLVWNGVYAHVGVCNKDFDDIGTPSGQRQRLRALGFKCGKAEDDTKLAGPIRAFNGHVGPTVPEGCRFQKGDPVPQPDTLDPEKRAQLIELSDRALARQNAVAPGAGRRRLLSATRWSRRRTATYANLRSPGVKVVSVPRVFHGLHDIACIKLEIDGLSSLQSMLVRIYRNVEESAAAEHAPTKQMVYQEVLRREDIERLPEDITGQRNHVVEQDARATFLLKYNAQFDMSGGDGAFAPIGMNNTFWHQVHAPFLVAVWSATTGGAFDAEDDQAEALLLHEATPPFPPAYLERIPPPDPAPPLSHGEITGRLDALHEGISEEQKAQIARLDHVEGFPDETATAAIEGWLQAIEDAEGDAVGERGQPLDELLGEPPEELHQSRSLASDWDTIRQRLEQREGGPQAGDAAAPALRLKAGKNLMGKRCKEHGREFHHKHRINLEPFAREVQRQPLAIYQTLWARAQALPSTDTDGFHFPELEDTFKNLERHLGIVEQRLCCGEWARLADRSLEEKAAEVLEKLRQDIAAERAAAPAIPCEPWRWQTPAGAGAGGAFAVAFGADRMASGTVPGFRYKNSIRLIVRSLRVIGYLVGQLRAVPELEAHERMYGVAQRLGGGNDAVRSGRARSMPLGHVVESAADWAGMPAEDAGGDGLHAAYEDEFKQNNLPGKYRWCIGDLGPQRGSQEDKQAALDVNQASSRVVVVPSYNPLNLTFFSRVRQVPLFMMGMIDHTYLLADGIFQAPLSFFSHDAFHVMGDFSTENYIANSWRRARQQWATIHDHLLEKAEATTPEQQARAYRIWNDNAAIIEKAVRAIGDKDLREAVDALLFSALHEPLNKKEIDAGEYHEDDAWKVGPIANPAILEAASIDLRISSASFLSDQERKMKNLYFGYVFPEHKWRRQADAVAKVREIIEQFTPTA
jgi:hypothetical protein